MKCKFVLIALMAFAIAAMPILAYAGGHDKGGPDFSKMLLSKMGLALKNKEELGLTDQQEKDIKKIKTDTKKSLIKQGAEIQLVCIDIKALMWEDKIDTKAVNSLIDKKYDLKKEKAKMLIASCAQFRGILTDEQSKQIKALWKKCKMGKMKGKMGGMKDKMNFPKKGNM